MVALYGPNAQEYAATMEFPSRICDLFGIRYPIFAFTHTREVVAAVSRAGGLGIYGAAPFAPERVDTDLAWIAAQLDGEPFGVDVMLPLQSEGSDLAGSLAEIEAELDQQIPAGHRTFVEELTQRFEIGPLADAPTPPEDPRPGGRGWRSSWHDFRLGAVAHGGQVHAQVAMKHPIALLVSALGPPSASLVEDARRRNIKLGALVGSARHAQRQVAAGVDVIVAQGTEAAAHTGEISTMVLVPEVVDAVAPVPVLAAGGIGDGRQMAAAFALGAQGAWMGSVWLTCAESDEPPEVIDRLIAAGSGDTVRSTCRTGKPLRQLRCAWTDAWDDPGSPGSLPMPLQHLLTAEAEERMHRHHRGDQTTIPVGQVVGRLNARPGAAEVVAQLVDDYTATIDALRNG